MNLPSSKTYGFWLALFRIYVGLFWLAHAIPKFETGFMPPGGVMDSFLAPALTQYTGPYHDFVVNVVNPNITLFANLVRIGELLTGCVLILGFQSRIGAFVGIVLAFNYLAAQNAVFSAHGWSSVDGAAIVLSFLNLVLPTGKYLGIDALSGRGRNTAPATSTAPTTVAVTPVASPSAPAAAAGPIHAEFVDETPAGTAPEVRRL